MSPDIRRSRTSAFVFAASAALVVAGATLLAQQPAAGRGAAQAPRGARTAAPLDLEGNWVSVVTEDWRWRMMTPAKGDAPGVPLSLEGRRVANQWDLARDNATGNQCKAYGVGGIMRIPGRIRITWQEDNTLKMEFDAGRQTRIIRFLDPVAAARASRGEPSMQGFSVGTWTTRTTGAPILNEQTPAGRGGGGAGPVVDQQTGLAAPAKGSLKVVTTNVRPGYFRKNGLPYSENATITEYFDRHDDFGAQWFTVLTVLDEPTYLVSPFVTTTHFKREPDGSKWNPQPCETLPPTAPVSRGEQVGSVPN